MTSIRSRVPEFVISGVIVAVLVFQLVAIVLRLPTRAWPFVNYPMYSVPHEESDLIHRLTLKVQLSDGRSVALDPGGAVLRDWRFRNQYFEAIRCLSGDGAGQAEAPAKACRDDPQTYRDRLADLRRRYEALHGARIERFSISDEPVRVRREGAERLPPREVASFDAAGLGQPHDG